MFDKTVFLKNQRLSLSAPNLHTLLALGPLVHQLHQLLDLYCLAMASMVLFLDRDAALLQFHQVCLQRN